MVHPAEMPGKVATIEYLVLRDPQLLTVDLCPAQITLETCDGRFKDSAVDGTGTDIDLRPSIFVPGLSLFPLVTVGVQVEKKGMPVLPQHVSADHLHQFMKFPVFPEAAGPLF